MLDAGMDAIEPDSDPEAETAREALWVVAQALVRLGYDPDHVSLMLAWPAHELDVEFYWEAEGVH